MAAEERRQGELPGLEPEWLEGDTYYVCVHIYPDHFCVYERSRQSIFGGKVRCLIHVQIAISWLAKWRYHIANWL